MFDANLVEDNKVAQLGLRYLAESGIIDAQMEALQARLVMGDAAEDEAVMVKQIRGFRMQYTHLATLKELAEYYNKEGNDQ